MASNHLAFKNCLWPTLLGNRNLRIDALLEDKEAGERSSSEGKNELTPYNDKTSASYRYYLYLKNQDIDTLIKIFAAEPRIAAIFFKQLLKDDSLALEKKNLWISKVAEKVPLTQLLRDEKTLEELEKIAPQSVEKYSASRKPS